MSPAADVFALGTTLRELLADQAPTSGLQELLNQMTSADPAHRPDDDAVLHLLRRAGRDSPGLWPGWATSALDRPVLL